VDALSHANNTRPCVYSRLSGRGLNRSRQVLALVREGDEGDQLGHGIEVSRRHPTDVIPASGRDPSDVKLGTCRSDKNLALRHRVTLYFLTFLWLGRIPGQAGDDVSEWREAGLKSNGVGRREDTSLNETEAAVAPAPASRSVGLVF